MTIIKPSDGKITNENIELILAVIHTKTLEHKKVRVKSKKYNRIIFDVGIDLVQTTTKKLTYFDGRASFSVEQDDEIYYD